MTIETIKQANADAGQHFFSPDTLRFFSSRVSAQLHRGTDGAVYFVTSEQCNSYTFGSGVRKYTVRVTRDGGRTIDTVGEFHSYRTARQAHARAAYLARGE